MKKFLLVLAVLLLTTAATYSQIAIALEKDLQKSKPVERKTRVYEAEPEEESQPRQVTKTRSKKGKHDDLAELQAQLNKLSYGNGRTTTPPAGNKKKI